MKDHEYFVYIMSSRSGTLYIGITNSIYRRTSLALVRRAEHRHHSASNTT